MRNDFEIFIDILVTKNDADFEEVRESISQLNDVYTDIKKSQKEIATLLTDFIDKFERILTK